MNEIEVKNVSVNYGSVRALDNINLKIRKGEFLGIIGPNGGGKTTLLKALLGLIKPSEGEIIIKNNKSIGYVPQFSNFDRSFPISVIDVVLMGTLKGRMKFFKKYKKEDIKNAEKIMKDLGISEFRNRQIGQLSGGQLQKVLIARALIMDPDIIILDEPTASLDANSKTEIYDLLKNLNATKTIIIVSHDVGVINSYIGNVACLNKNLYYHGNDNKLNQDILEKVYGCPVEILAHGDTPHRVVMKHEEDKK